MAATLATSFKQLIEAAGLGLSAYRDAAPSDASLPFVVITTGISTIPDLVMGDAMSNGDTAIENCQVDLYQQYANTTNPNAPTIAENYTLPGQLRRLLHGASLPAPPFRVYAVRVELSSRSREVENNLVRTRYSVNVRRDN